MEPPLSVRPKSKTPDLFNLSDYKKVHPFLKTRRPDKLFYLAGRRKYFLKNWEKVINNSTILSIVKGYSIDFVEPSYQTKRPISANLNQAQEELVWQEVKEMQEMGVIR